MPSGNNFQHAPYSRADPGDRVWYREFTPGASPDSVAWQDAMARHGLALAQAGVRTVLLMHGTFLGTDLFGVQRLDEAGGLKRGYSRGIPGVDALLALMRDGTNGLPAFKDGRKPPLHDDEETRAQLDLQAGDAANFPKRALDLLSAGLNRDLRGAPPIACVRHLWSCAHHHLGRAQAAIQVLARLRALAAEHRLGPGDRVLVLAHGHAGQVLALVSNLLAPEAALGRDHLLRTLNAYYAEIGAEPTLTEQLEAVTRALSSGDPLGGVALDVVTFGTPVRYGWEPDTLGRLLHVVNHRPLRLDGKRWLAKVDLPQITMEMPLVLGGDYLQQLAVAGSDAVPATPPAQAANKALWELLEPYDGFERWLECVRRCVRCPQDGLCLLVDYKDTVLPPAGKATDVVYGHAAYTRLNALLFNITEIVHALYPVGSPA
ncbi:hypothetical protein [Nitrospira sp. Kam-Ns4a]